jgi:hypothetical protein
VLGWFYRHLGGRSRGGMGAVLGGLDELFHPEAARARETIERDHSLVVPMPSPGDRMLDEGRLVLGGKEPAEGRTPDVDPG